MDIINERTVGMSYEEYVERRKQANAERKNHKKGELIFISSIHNMKLKGMKGRTAKRKTKIQK